MKKKKAVRKPKNSGRTLLSSAVRATTHPTRELILRELREHPCSTLELENVTGENRYNLYHHLSVLEDAQLITATLDDDRKTKRYELFRPSKPELSLLILDEKDEKEARTLKNVLKYLKHSGSEDIPHLDEIRRAKMIFYYPWSQED